MKPVRLLALVLTVAALSACAAPRRDRQSVVVVRQTPPPSPLYRAPTRLEPEPRGCEEDSCCRETRGEEPVCATRVPTPERSDPCPEAYRPQRSDPFPPPRSVEDRTPSGEHPVFDEHPGRGHGVMGTDPKIDHPVFEEHPGHGHGRDHEEAAPDGETRVTIIVPPEERERKEPRSKKVEGKKSKAKKVEKEEVDEKAEDEPPPVPAEEGSDEEHDHENASEGTSKENGHGKGKAKGRDKDEEGS